MLSLLTGLLGIAGPITQLGMKIADLMVAKQAAKTETEKALIQEQIEQLHSQRDVLVASMGNPVSRTIYWVLLSIAAIGPVTYISKIFLWDKVVGSIVGCTRGVAHLNDSCSTFTTDALVDPNLWWVVIAVFTFLFLASRNKQNG